jgi:hypothetical protein
LGQVPLKPCHGRDPAQDRLAQSVESSKPPGSHGQRLGLPSVEDMAEVKGDLLDGQPGGITGSG